MLLVGTGTIAGHLHAIFLLGDLHAEGAIVKRNCHFAVEVCVCVCMYCVTRYVHVNTKFSGFVYHAFFI